MSFTQKTGKSIHTHAYTCIPTVKVTNICCCRLQKIPQTFLIPTQRPFAVWLYSSFLWDVESIFPNPLNMNLVICFDFMCLKFQIWRRQRLEKCLCCGVFPLLLLGILLSSYEWGWASLLHDGRCMAVPSADIELTPDMWRLLSPKSLPTARQVTEGIQDHPPQWVSLDNTIQLALEWYKCLLF